MNNCFKYLQRNRITCNYRKYNFYCVLIFLGIILGNQNGYAQKIDTSYNRVKTDFKVDYPFIGSVKPRSITELEPSNWMIGCETLDRDFADYDQYKEYLAPLGIQLIRLQAGWAKTEKTKGKYDWAWLDHIVDDATSRGLKPWLQTSYGNTLYKDGGGDNLGAGMPTSPEAIEGYNKWVAAMVKRYKDRVTNWEIWNEPNFGDNIINTPEMTAIFNIRTAEIIKNIQPTAKISGLALGHFNYDFVDRFFKYIGHKKKMHLFDNMTYHDYAYNPDANYHEVYLIRMLLDKYGGEKVKLRQGENGAPSSGGPGRGAIGDHDWTEFSQAKWDTRRMLGNLGHDIECSIFTIIDIAYTSGPIKRLNVKGLIQSDSTKQAVKPKIAFYAIQNVASIFDNNLERIKEVEHTYNIDGAMAEKHLYSRSTDRSTAVYGYHHKKTGKQLYTIWMDDNIPTNAANAKKITFSFSMGDFDQPVFVDIITGAVYEIPLTQWSKKGNTYTFKDVPVFDGPIVIADKTLIKVNSQSQINFN